MKFILAGMLGLLSVLAIAEEGQISMDAGKASLVSTSNNMTEVGFQYSSINNGTLLATASLVHDFDNGFNLGVRGGLPLDFKSESSVYLIQVIGRFMFMNDVNQMYLEPSLTEGFFNQTGGPDTFTMLGVSYGYNRMLTKEFSVGGQLGVDFSTARISDNQLSGGSNTLYSHLSINGSYLF